MNEADLAARLRVSERVLAKVKAAMQQHPMISIGYEGGYPVIVVLDQPEDGDVVCSHSFSIEGLDQAIACAKADYPGDAPDLESPPWVDNPNYPFTED